MRRLLKDSEHGQTKWQIEDPPALCFRLRLALARQVDAASEDEDEDEDEEDEDYFLTGMLNS